MLPLPFPNDNKRDQTKVISPWRKALLVVSSALIALPLVGRAESKSPHSKISLQGVSIDIAETSGALHSVQLGGVMWSSVEVQNVQNPSRIVIDLLGARAGKNVSQDLPHSSIKRVRLGTHPDKTRVVLDLVNESIPPYNVNQNKKVVVLTFQPNDSHRQPNPDLLSQKEEPTPLVTPVQPPSPATPSPTPSPSPRVTVPATTPIIQPSVRATPTVSSTPSIRETPSPTPKSTPIVVMTPTPAPTPVVTAKVGGTQQSPPAEVGGQVTVTELAFSFVGATRTPTVQITTSQKPEFKLLKKDETSYILNIPNSRLAGGHLTLPQFPPHDFSSFTVVVAENKGDTTEITLGVERGKRITAFVEESGISVRPNE